MHFHLKNDALPAFNIDIPEYNILIHCTQQGSKYETELEIW